MLKIVVDRVINKVTRLGKQGALHIVIGSFLTKFVSFFGSVFLVRLLSKSDYGVLCYYENFTSYFLILAGLGLASGLLRHMVLAENTALKKASLLHALQRGCKWNIFLVAVCLVACFVYPHPVAFRGNKFVATCLVLAIPAIFCLNVALCSLRSMFDYKSYAYLAFITSVLLIFMRVIGAMIGGLNLTTLFRLIAEIFCAIGCLYFVNKKYFASVTSTNLAIDFQKDFDSYSMQIMLTDGLWAVFMLNDIFLLGQLCGNKALIADYKVAYVIPANLAIFVSAVGTFVSPYFTKYESERNYAWVRKNMFMVLAVTCIIMLCLISFFGFFAKPAIILLYGKKYLSAVPVMKLLLVASFFNNAIRGSIANVLSAMGAQKQNLCVASIGIVVQVILDILCIPKFGAIGVAYSSMIVYIVMSFALGIIFYCRYCRDIKEESKDARN